MHLTREFLIDVFLRSLAALRVPALVENRRDSVLNFIAGSPAPLLLAVGKAAQGMTQGLAQMIDAFDPLSLITSVYAPQAKVAQTSSVRHIEASHPLPNAQSARAASLALHAVATVDEATPIIVAISGGASSAWCAPRRGLSRDDVILAWKTAMNLGLDIKTLNLLRRSLSSIKGGGLLAAAAGKRVLNLALLDIVDGRAQDLGSGPGVYPDADDARQWQKLNAVCDHFSPAVCAVLRRANDQRRRPGAATVNSSSQSSWHVLADPSTLRAKACEFLRSDFYKISIDAAHKKLQGPIEQQATLIAQWLTGAAAGQALVLGGENDIVLPAQAGQGGRAQHLALLVLQKMRACRRQWSVLSVASDGVDGNSAAAGAIVDETSVARFSAVRCQQALRSASSAELFAACDEQLVTAATGTNLCDLLIAWAR